MEWGGEWWGELYGCGMRCRVDRTWSWCVTSRGGLGQRGVMVQVWLRLGGVILEGWGGVCCELYEWRELCAVVGGR